MGCCAVGTCIDPNCYLCKTVAAGKVKYRTAYQRGFIEIECVPIYRRKTEDSVRKGEDQLTKRQAKKRNAK